MNKQWVTIMKGRDIELDDSEATRCLKAIVESAYKEPLMQAEARKFGMSVTGCFGRKVFVSTQMWVDRFGRHFEYVLDHYNCTIETKESPERTLYDAEYADDIPAYGQNKRKEY